MRVSNPMMQHDALRGIRARLESLARAQEQAATGKRIEAVSDEPIDASQIMRLDSHLRDIDQFRRNATAARTRMNTEDVVLTTARDLVQRAKEIAISGATQSPSDPIRLAALAEIQQIQSQLISLGNTKLGNEYIFGGGETSKPPFLGDGTYIGDAKVRMAEIDGGVMVETTHTGDELFGDLLQSVADLVNELQTGTQTAIQSMSAVLGASGDQLLAKQAELGGRLRGIEQNGQHLAQQTASFLDQRQSLAEVDPAQALLEVTSAQTALERAYAVIGKSLSTNLLDYLR